MVPRKNEVEKIMCGICDEDNRRKEVAQPREVKVQQVEEGEGAETHDAASERSVVDDRNGKGKHP